MNAQIRCAVYGGATADRGQPDARSSIAIFDCGHYSPSIGGNFVGYSAASPTRNSSEMYLHTLKLEKGRPPAAAHVQCTRQLRRHRRKS